MKVLEYIIRALDKTAEGNRTARAGVSDTAKAIISQMANIKAAWDMASSAITGAARHVWSALKEAFKFETLTVQFSVLMGSMEKARERMRELSDFAASTPFQLEEVVVASRQLHVFSNGALGAKESLRMVGDAAAAVGQNIQEVSFWVGRAYSMIKGGQPFGEAAMRLQEMGIITPEVRQKMEELQASGASNIEVWQQLEARLSSFKGGMDQLSKTGDGLVSTLKDNWIAGVREFGNAFKDSAKEGILTLSEALEQLAKDGTISLWASKAVRALEVVREAAGWTASAVKWIYERSGASDAVAALRGSARFAGSLAGGGGLGEAMKAYGTGQATGFYSGKLLSAAGDPGGLLAYNKRADDEQRAADAEFKRRAAAAKAAESSQPKADPEQEKKKERERIAADMAAAQKLTDAKRAKEAAEKEAEEREKAAQKEAQERARLSKELVEAEHKQRVANIRDEAAASAAAESAARDRLSRANSAAQQAWGWYRDPESFKRQLQEEKANAAAEKQYAKDFDRLNDRRDWRTTTRLTDSEEAVRRVALAREEQDRALRSLQAIEKHTAGLDTMLKQLLTAK